ncbi:hypothetical protein [Dactylosporangium roseum]|nr:hypothetical protein [Dactylosporangium roseum]
MKTLVGSPELPRPRNEVTSWVNTTTTTAANTAMWLRLDIKR